MALETKIDKNKKNNAIDMLITLIVEELSEELKMDPDETLSKFVASKTGELLYDEKSNLWWNGPSYIAELFKKEQNS
jgi:hypothetical protein